MNTKEFVKIFVFAPIVATLLLSFSDKFACADQNGESSWKALSIEPSRGELFQSWAQRRSVQSGVQRFAFPYSFQFPTDADQDTKGNPRLNSYFGIDISHHNGEHFPLATLKRQHVTFIYMKATQGTGYADKTFGENWTGVRALPDNQKIPRGAYHFLSSDPRESGSDQADRFLAYVALHGGFADGDMRPAIDLEWDKACKTCPDRWKTNKRSPNEIITTVIDFANRIKEKTGWTPILYTNKSFLSDVGITGQVEIRKITSSVKIWIFDLSESDRNLEIANQKSNLPYQLWQFSWGGRLSHDYADSVDVDSFKGTNADFQSLFFSRN